MSPYKIKRSNNPERNLKDYENYISSHLPLCILPENDCIFPMISNKNDYSHHMQKSGLYLFLNSN